MKRAVIFFTILTMMGWSVVGVSAQTESIEYGAEVTGTISTAEPSQAWTFTGVAGDIVSIEMQAASDDIGGLDSFLILQTPNGDVLAENDDASGTTVDAALFNIELVDDGEHTIIATRFGQENGISEGDYILTLNATERGTPAAAPSNNDESSEEPAPLSGDAMPLDIGASVRGNIGGDAYQGLWQFEGEAGTVITIEMTAEDGDLDSFLQLLDADGAELERNDDRDFGDLNSTIESYTLPYTGTYTIVATRYGLEQGNSSGAYTLSISISDTAIEESSGEAPAPQPEPSPEASTPTDETPPPASAPEQEAQPSAIFGITYGEQLIGTVVDNQVTVYQFLGAANDVVTISVKRTDSTLNPFVTLRDPNGTVLAENDRFNGVADARITDFVLPAEGDYQIVVAGESGTSGEFVVYLLSDMDAPVREAPLSTEVEDSEDVSDEPEPTAEPETDTPEDSETVDTPDEDTTSAPTAEPMEPLDLSNATLTITLAWEGSADFDLIVTDADGNVIDFIRTSSPSGGIFGGDANGFCSANSLTPSETVYWEGEYPTGDYEIEVFFVDTCDDDSPTDYTLTLAVEGDSLETFEGSLDAQNSEVYTYTIE